VTDQPLSIAYLIPALVVGGAERQLFALANAVGRRGWRPVVITYDGWDRSAFMPHPSVSVREVPKRGSPLAFLRRLKRVLEEERVSVLHSYLNSAQAYSMLLRLTGWDGRLIFGVRDSLPRYQPRTLKNVVADALVFNQVLAADRYVFNSRAGFLSKARHVRAGRSFVINNAIDTARFRPSDASRAMLRSELGLRADAIVIGIVANASPLKGYPTFLRAARRILDVHSEAQFVVVGKMQNEHGESIVRLARELDIGGRVHFLGPRRDVDLLMPAFDVLCSSSSSEGFSNAIAEAMACAIPCVVTNVGDSGAIVGVTGRVVPPNEPDALADAVVSLFDGGGHERRRLGELARRRIVEQFSMCEVAERHMELYRSALQ
jgi:glycosyltransferase involved in cell wall biosynthesis